MADRYTPLRKELDERYAEAMAYRGGDAFAAFARLLQAIDRCYDEDLRTADADRTAKVRGASAQCRALFDALVDRSEHAQAPKI